MVYVVMILNLTVGSLSISTLKVQDKWEDTVAVSKKEVKIVLYDKTLTYVIKYVKLNPNCLRIWQQFGIRCTASILANV
jgi:hypothetical protein